MRLRAGALAAATALAAAGLLALPDGTAASSPPTTCSVEHALHVAPDPVALGQDVVVTFAATADCRAAIENHVVLVVDGSDAMDSESGRSLREGARRLGDSLLSGSYNRSAVGVVTFDRAARRLAPLTHDRAAFASAMRRLDARPGTRIDLGLALAHAVLRAGRTALDGPRFAEVVVLFSRGRCSARCDVAAAEAAKLKAENVLVMSICHHLDCDRDCSRRIASLPRHVWVIGEGGPSQDSLFRWSHPIATAGWAITATVGGGLTVMLRARAPACRRPSGNHRRRGRLHELPGWLDAVALRRRPGRRIRADRRARSGPAGARPGLSTPVGPRPAVVALGAHPEKAEAAVEALGALGSG